MQGFIPGSRASFTMDLVVIAMALVLPLLTTAVILAKKGHFVAHKRLQIAISTALLLVVVLFEVDVRLNGWTDAAKDSPYYDTALFPLLWLHLSIAVTTTVAWYTTVILALRRFSSVPAPGPYSSSHRKMARVAGAGMFLTAISGWTFYWMAFLA